MRIAVLANLKQNAPRWEGMSPDQWDDLDSPRSVNAILQALTNAGHEATMLEASILPPHNLVQRLEEYKPDICFNIAEGHYGDGREAQIPALLEMLRIPYTGSKVLTLALTLDKPMTKRVLMYHGLPTPEFQVFEDPDETVDTDLINEDGELRFPMFVKPSREGTSIGVSAKSIVRTVAELREQVADQIARFNQPILCEHFIEGREVMIGIVGNFEEPAARRVHERRLVSEIPDSMLMLPPMEVDLTAYEDTEANVYTNRIKVEFAETFKYACPADLDAETTTQLNLLAATVFRVTDCKDVARIDFRLDKHNGYKPYILEVNPLPGLSPGVSDLVIQATGAGWSYDQLITSILAAACERQGLPLEQSVQ